MISGNSEFGEILKFHESHMEKQYFPKYRCSGKNCFGILIRP
jgi:hypothetical protein